MNEGSGLWPVPVMSDLQPSLQKISNETKKIQESYDSKRVMIIHPRQTHLVFRKLTCKLFFGSSKGRYFLREDTALFKYQLQLSYSSLFPQPPPPPPSPRNGRPNFWVMPMLQKVNVPPTKLINFDNRDTIASYRDFQVRCHKKKKGRESTHARDSPFKIPSKMRACADSRRFFFFFFFFVTMDLKIPVLLQVSCLDIYIYIYIYSIRQTKPS